MMATDLLDQRAAAAVPPRGDGGTIAAAVIGSREFVEDFFKANPERFSERRKTGARPMRFGDWGGMCSLRDLRVNVIEPPPS